MIRLTTAPISFAYLLKGQLKYMKTRGLNVLAISADGPEKQSVMQFENCSYITVPMTRAITPFNDLLNLIRLVRIFRREKPDIVHTHTPKAGLLGMLAAKFCRVPIRIHTVAGLPFLTLSGLKRKILMQTEIVTYWAAGFIWPNSYSLYNYIKSKNLVSDKKLELIEKGSSNGVDLQKWSKEQLDPQLIEKTKIKINYDPKNKYLLFLGRIVKDKGIVSLFEAFKSVFSKYDQIRLVLLGTFELNRKAESIPFESINELLGHPGIIHIEWSESPEYYLATADFLINPSLREGFSNALLQAGAMGIPVICSSIPGNTDLIQDHSSGLLFNAGDSEDMANKILYALLNPKEMESKADRLKKHVQNNFNQDCIHRAICARYKELIGDNYEE